MQGASFNAGSSLGPHMGDSAGSASDLAALYEAQQAQLEAQHSQLVDQQRALQALQSANSQQARRRLPGRLRSGTDAAVRCWRLLKSPFRLQTSEAI